MLKIDPEIRFWLKVDKYGPRQSHMKTRCWVWTASRAGGHEEGGSYGQFWDGERNLLAHNYALRLRGRQARKGKQPDHLCRTKLCVRTSHIQFVTTRENCRRRNENKTHCKYGHEYTPENTYVQEKWNQTPGKKRYWEISRHCMICRTVRIEKRKFGGAEGLSWILSKVQRTEGKRRKIKIVRNKK